MVTAVPMYERNNSHGYNSVPESRFSESDSNQEHSSHQGVASGWPQEAVRTLFSTNPYGQMHPLTQTDYSDFHVQPDHVSPPATTIHDWSQGVRQYIFETDQHGNELQSANYGYHSTKPYPAYDTYDTNESPISGHQSQPNNVYFLDEGSGSSFSGEEGYNYDPLMQRKDIDDDLADMPPLEYGDEIVASSIAPSTQQSKLRKSSKSGKTKSKTSSSSKGRSARKELDQKEWHQLMRMKSLSLARTMSESSHQEYE